MVSILFLLAATQGGFAADPSLLRRGVTAARYTKPRLAVAEPPTTDLAAAEPPKPIKAFPCGDDLDKRITTLAVPALLNFLILPITGAVDLLFIGQLGEALATGEIEKEVGGGSSAVLDSPPAIGPGVRARAAGS